MMEFKHLIYLCFSEQSADPKDGRFSHGPLTCYRQGRQQYPNCDAGDWMPYSLSRLQPLQPAGKKQSGKPH